MSRSGRVRSRVGEPESAGGRSDATTRRLLRHWHEAVPDDRMAHLIKDATRALLRALQARLARHDVALGHWTFLRILWQRDGLTKSELSDEAGVAAPTTVIALRAMEASGHVRMEQRPDNRKNVYIYLTPAGRALERKLVPLAEEINAIALADVPASDVAATRRTLLSIIENLARDEARRA